MGMRTQETSATSDPGIPWSKWVLCLAVVVLVWTATASAVPHWQVEPSRSHLGFTATQAGAAIKGEFASFHADIYFAASDLASSRFTVDIRMTSVDTGDRERDDYLRSPQLFAVERWPTARFVTVGFEHEQGNRYVAEGDLTIRDITRRIQLPFTFQAADNEAAATLAGGLTIRRLEYGVGQGDWSDTSWVGDAVTVTFSLYLTPS